MPYIDRNGNQRFTLKEKYKYYKDIAMGKTDTKSGKKAEFLGRVASANKANKINRKMGKHMRARSYYGSGK